MQPLALGYRQIAGKDRRERLAGWIETTVNGVRQYDKTSIRGIVSLDGQHECPGERQIILRNDSYYGNVH
jgi:hypothetical protein